MNTDFQNESERGLQAASTREPQGYSDAEAG